MNRSLTAALILLALGCGACENRDQPPELDAVPADEPSDDVMTQMRGAEAGGAEHPGAAVYADHCASCHDGSVPRAPHKSFLEMMAGDMILSSMREGVMQQQSNALTEQQQVDVAEFLAGNAGRPAAAMKSCSADLQFDYRQPPALHSWGMAAENTRFIPASVAQLPKDSVENLTVKWAFGP